MELLTLSRTIPRPRLAVTVLASTSAVLLSALSLWLAYWLLFVRPDLNVLAIWSGPSPSSWSATELFFQESDARIFGRKAMKKPESAGHVAASVREFLESKGQRPAIVYLSIPAVSPLRNPSPGDAAEDPNRLAIDPGVVDGISAGGRSVTGMNLTDILDEFRKRPRQKKLLILDIGQIDTDRDLGVFANDFASRLKQQLDKGAEENFTVLCSCAPGQSSWSSDADRRSVFAHFVADGLSRARDVQELVVDVKKRVHQWVKTHRNAIQTPISWGSPTANFLLPKGPGEPGMFPLWEPAPRAADSPWRKQDAQDLLKHLSACYQRRDNFADQRPYRYAPRAWREYQETLLRAERLYRAGLFPECADVIKRVDGLEQGLKNPFTTLPKSGYPSLEMGFLIASGPEFHPEWGSDREWERALAWPLTPNAPDPVDKPKGMSATGKKGGGIVSSEIGEKAEKGEAGVAGKAKPLLPPVLAMIAEGKNPWETFVEGQLIDWGIEWTKSHPIAIFLSDRSRAEVFRQALRVRRLAERAASASWQSGPWSEALLQAGDAARRQAQDNLFAGDQNSDAVSQLLKDAEIAYERAGKYGKALELTEEIRSQWPFLGTWKVQRAASSGPREVFRNAEFIVNFTNRFAKLAARLDPWRPRESPTDARYAEFEREYEGVRQDFEQVRADYKSVLDSLSPSSSWREINDLLGVPMIAAQQRTQLVAMAVARSLEVGLLPRPKATRPAEGKPEVKPADGKTDAKPLELAGEPADGPPGGSGETDMSPDADEGPEPDAVADPAFWARAHGMALLEWSLLTMANVEGMLPAGSMTRQGNGPLDPLRDAITSAGQIDVKSDPARAFESYRDRVSNKIRNVRSWISETCVKLGEGLGDSQEPGDDNHRNRFALERTLTVLPLALAEEIDVLVKNPRFAKLSAELAGFQIQSLLLRHARRLLDDLDTNRAGIFLKMADGMGNESPEVLKVRQRLATIQSATIKFGGAKVVVSGDTYENKMEVAIEPDRQIPRGRAVISFGTIPNKDLVILPAGARAPSKDTALGVGVSVDPDGPPATVGYIVQRGVDIEDRDGIVVNRDRSEKILSPLLFYRGHTFQTAEPIKVVLEPLKDIIYVRLAQDRKNVAKGFYDQFRVHPDEGYMHYCEDLKYELVLTNVKTDGQEVFVDYKLEEDPESERHETIKLKGKESKVVIKDMVRGVDAKKLGLKAVKSREVDLGRPRYLEVDVWDSPARGRRLTTKRFRFTHLDVDAYAAMLPVYFANEVVFVSVRHLESDPGKGYIEDVIANVAGMSQIATTLRDGQGPPCKIGENKCYEFWFGVDPKTPKVTFSVKIGKKSNAFGGTLALNPDGAEKDKDKDKQKEKDAEGPKE